MRMMSYLSSMTRRGWSVARTLCVLITVIACLTLHATVPQTVYAANSEESSGTSDLITGAACFVLTPVYGAFKLAFAGAGILIGGLTWVFTGGDDQAAQRVWDASLKGTYIITPEHLAGEKPVIFIGSTES